METKTKHIFLTINHNITVVIRSVFKKKSFGLFKWLVGGQQMGECIDWRDGGFGGARREMGVGKTKLFDNTCGSSN